jgi:hypothetical protein
MKSRIIIHMNADHAHSLVLYARHYNKLPLAFARTARLEDITPTHLTMSSSFGRLLVPLDPPLASLAQSRERLVAMHAECLEALGVEDVEVTEYRRPNRTWQWGFMAGVVAVYVSFPFGESMRPGSGGWGARLWSLDGRVDWLGELAWFLKGKFLLPLVVAIHVVEAYVMATGRLRRYNVEVMGRVWWCWVVSVFLEGFGAFMRFDEVVADIREKRGADKMEAKDKMAKDLKERRAAAAGEA